MDPETAVFGVLDPGRTLLSTSVIHVLFRVRARSLRPFENPTKICCSDRIVRPPYRSRRQHGYSADVDGWPGRGDVEIPAAGWRRLCGPHETMWTCQRRSLSRSLARRFARRSTALR